MGPVANDERVELLLTRGTQSTFVRRDGSRENALQYQHASRSYSVDYFALKCEDASDAFTNDGLIRLSPYGEWKVQVVSGVGSQDMSKVEQIQFHFTLQQRTVSGGSKRPMFAHDIVNPPDGVSIVRDGDAGCPALLSAGAPTTAPPAASTTARPPATNNTTPSAALAVLVQELEQKLEEQMQALNTTMQERDAACSVDNASVACQEKQAGVETIEKQVKAQEEKLEEVVGARTAKSSDPGDDDGIGPGGIVAIVVILAVVVAAAATTAYVHRRGIAKQRILAELAASKQTVSVESKNAIYNVPVEMRKPPGYVRQAANVRSKVSKYTAGSSIYGDKAVAHTRPTTMFETPSSNGKAGSRQTVYFGGNSYDVGALPKAVRGADSTAGKTGGKVLTLKHTKLDLSAFSTDDAPVATPTAHEQASKVDAYEQAGKVNAYEQASKVNAYELASVKQKAAVGVKPDGEPGRGGKRTDSYMQVDLADNKHKPGNAGRGGKGTDPSMQVDLAADNKRKPGNAGRGGKGTDSYMQVDLADNKHKPGNAGRGGKGTDPYMQVDI